MPAALSLFQSLADGFQKKLGDLVAVALWAGLGLAAKFAWDLWRQWRADRQKAKQSNPVYLNDKRVKLNIAADRACRWAGADHVSVYQFSNGEYYSNRDSIQKINLVAEAMGDNLVRGWMVESQNLPVAAFTGFLDAVQQGHTWLYRDECEDYELNRVMRERGYQCAVGVLLKGPKNSWLGLLIVAWGEGRFTDEHLDLALLTSHQRDTAAILAAQ